MSKCEICGTEFKKRMVTQKICRSHECMRERARRISFEMRQKMKLPEDQRPGRKQKRERPRMNEADIAINNRAKLVNKFLLMPAP